MVCVLENVNAESKGVDKLVQIYRIEISSLKDDVGDEQNHKVLLAAELGNIMTQEVLSIRRVPFAHADNQSR